MTYHKGGYYEKSVISFVLILSLSLSLLSPAFAVTQHNEETLLSESDICEILQNFELEISYIEQKYSIVIQTINDEVMDLIKQEAIINYSGPYHFCELVDAITLEYAKNMIVDTFALNDDVGPKVYLEKEFGPLK